MNGTNASAAKPTPGDLARQMASPVIELGELVEAWTDGLPDRDRLPVHLRLVALASDLLQTVRLVQCNLDEGDAFFLLRNLQNLPGLTEQMTAATRAAFVEYQTPLPALYGRCLATVHLGDDEREWLEFRPGAVNEVPAELHCALQADHREPHAANAQMGNDVEWWAHWTLRAFEIARMRGCQIERANTDPNSLEETDVCLLYADHPGRHSYEIGD